MLATLIRRNRVFTRNTNQNQMLIIIKGSACISCGIKIFGGNKYGHYDMVCGLQAMFE